MADPGKDPSRAAAELAAAAKKIAAGGGGGSEDQQAKLMATYQYYMMMQQQQQAAGGHGAAPAAKKGASAAPAAARPEAQAASSAQAAAAQMAAAAGQAGAGAQQGGMSEQALSAYYLLAQVSVMIEMQIKKAKQEAEHNFRVEIGKVRKDTQSVQVFTEQQGNVVAAVSKDCAFMRSEVTRLTQSVGMVKQAIAQQQQSVAGVQILLEKVFSKFHDLEKKFTAVGLGRESADQMSMHAAAGYPSFGMGAPGMGGMPPMGEPSDELLALLGAMPRTPGGSAAKAKAKKGKAERAAEAKSKAKGMRADAPEFVPVSGESAALISEESYDGATPQGTSPEKSDGDAGAVDSPTVPLPFNPTAE